MRGGGLFRVVDRPEQHRRSPSLDVGNIVGNKSEKLQDMSITLGFGLPMSKKLSTANLAFKYGVMGRDDAPNYIRENYFSVYISMTLNEKWFNKRKIE